MLHENYIGFTELKKYNYSRVFFIFFILQLTILTFLVFKKRDVIHKPLCFQCAIPTSELSHSPTTTTTTSLLMHWCRNKLIQWLTWLSSSVLELLLSCFHDNHRCLDSGLQLSSVLKTQCNWFFLSVHLCKDRKNKWSLLISLGKIMFFIFVFSFVFCFPYLH